MRGKLLIVVDIVVWVGITPAGAGKTLILPSRSLHHPDHPRRCGENGDELFFRLRTIGSPPQVRGKQIFKQKRGVGKRITPAGAGKTIF